MKKRIVSLLMALALCLSLLPTAAFATENEPAEEPAAQEQTEQVEPAPAEPEEGTPVEDAEEEEIPEEPEEPEEQEEQPVQPEPAMLAMANGIAVQAGGHTHYLCGGSTCNGGSHGQETDETAFATEIKQVGGTLYIDDKEWTVSSSDNYALDGGVYYLSSDLTPDHMIWCHGSVTLCLNGKSITAKHEGDVIAAAYGVTFTLTDCKDTGRITHANTAVGGGVYVTGTFNMYGGSITGNKTSSRGGGVCVNGGSFKMFGGSITGNTALYGGGVGVNGSSSSFTMKGGSITGNVVEDKNGNGGGVYVDNNGSFTMTGGSITGNNAANSGGGVFVTGTFSAQGSSSIAGNYAGGTLDSATGVYKKGESGKDNNVYLPSGKTIDASGLGTDGKIGVTTAVAPTANNPVAIATGAGEVHLALFTSDEGYYPVYDATKKEIQLEKSKPHDHYLCGGGTCTEVGHDKEGDKITFKAWTSKTSLPSEKGYYYLTEDVTFSSPWEIANSVNNVVLCLNGHTIKMRDDKTVIIVGWGRNLTLTDCEPEGKVGKVTHTDGKTGRGVYVSENSTFTLYGGNITGNETANNSGGGGVCVYGTFNMCGGSITGNKAGWNGGGVYVRGTFNMSGGSITGNQASSSGGGVSVYGSPDAQSTFNMSGGSITGNNANYYGGGVYVVYGTFKLQSGSITGNYAGGELDSATGLYVQGENGKDNNVYLCSGRTIDASELNGGTIGVTTQDTPTADSPVAIATGAKDGVDYGSIFTPDVKDQDYTITRDGEKVYLTAHTHSWTYSVSSDGATITARCGDCNVSGGSVTIERPAHTTYGDGKEIKATVENTVEGLTTPGIVYKQGETTLGAAPTNAGTYTASITAGGVTASVEYTIGKADPQASDFTFTVPTTLTYDGNAKTASVTSAKNGMGAVTVKYFDKNNNEVTEVKNAGEYTVKINVAEGTNYNTKSGLAVGTFTIAKATYTGKKDVVKEFVASSGATQKFDIQLPSIPEGAEYGTPQYDPKAKDANNNEKDYTIFASGASGLDNKTGVLNLWVECGEVGVTQSVTIPVTGATNYADYSIIVEVKSVNKGDANVTITGLPTNAIYGDADFTLSASVTNKGDGTGVWTWSSSDESVLKVTGNGASAKVRVVGVGNAAITAAYESETTSGKGTTAEITVSPRAITVTADNKTMTVNGKLPEFTVSYGNLPAGVKAEDIFGTLPTASTTADGKTVGEFDITVTAGELKDTCKSNYAVKIVNGGKLTVTKQSGGYYYYTPTAGGTTDANKSPRTGDAGLLVYGLTALSGYTGTALVLRRKRED